MAPKFAVSTKGSPTGPPPPTTSNESHIPASGIPKFKRTPGSASSQISTPLSESATRVFRASIESPLRGKSHREDGAAASAATQKGHTLTKFVNQQGTLGSLAENIINQQEQEQELGYGLSETLLTTVRIVALKHWNEKVAEVQLEENNPLDVSKPILLLSPELSGKLGLLASGKKIQLGSPLTEEPLLSYLDWKMV